MEPFSITVGVLVHLLATVLAVWVVHDLPIPPGRGPLIGSLLWRAQRLPRYRPLRLLIGLSWPTIASLTLLEFAP